MFFFYSGSFRLGSHSALILNQPIANYPIQCEHCEESIYRYAMASHMKEKHPTENLPDIAIISKHERALVLGKNFNSKLAMQVTEMKKLKNVEIALFPLSEFWNKNSKEWKKSKIGAWAKANSERMKEIYGQDAFQ